MKSTSHTAQRNLSPSQRYQAFRQQQRYQKTVAASFADTLTFALDQFQIDSNTALEQGNNVLVAAPTGAGKTVVADFAIYLAQQRNVKAFYTTPIKALSNQKYHDLVALYGADKVGLLTGDTSINSEADIVVMTMEVLRNMLYERSTTLQALRYVVLDEIHYLGDPFRGAVWEEVIIHLPQSVRIIGLSATVSNVEDFSAWIESVRGKTKLIVSEHRPVPLEQHVLLQEQARVEPQVLDLYQQNKGSSALSKVNPSLVRALERLDARAMREHAQDRHPSDHRRHGKGSASKRSTRKAIALVRRYTPKRWAVVDELNYLGMLPGIYFIFSRNGCDEAVEQCLNAGLELTTEEEMRKIRAITDEMVAGQLSHEDLTALQFSHFRFALEEGFAAHHAGMIALFRQIVERLFEEGLLKVVFATETLALGINMPARSVIIEKLEKFNGTGQVPLTAGEYTQLTGRAGRRGIDTLGHAIVVDHAGFAPSTLTALTSKRVYPLHSSFKPTFNMAVNLLHTSDYATARDTLDHSFAQWEANESSGQLETQMAQLRGALAGYAKAFHCDFGDFQEFMTLRMQLTDLEKDERRRLKQRIFTSDEERTQAFQELNKRIQHTRLLLERHPCQHCPDLQAHLKWGHRWAREQRELQRIEHRYASRTGSVARQFDSICRILVDLGYLERHGTEAHTNYELTQKGELLRRIYSEHDLVLAQALTSGALDLLDARQLAAVLSSLVFQARRGAKDTWQLRHGDHSVMAQAARAMQAISSNISLRCQDEGLEPLQQLDFGLLQTMYEWTQGRDLGVILHSQDLTGGDFVRSAKRLSDILQQIAIAAPCISELAKESIALRADQAQRLVHRGVVAYSGVE